MKHTNGIPRVGIVSIVAAIAATAGITAAALVPADTVAAACSIPAANYGTATTTVTVSQAGSYRLWSRVMAADTSSNAYMLEVDGATCYTVGNSNISANAWTWIDYQNGSTATKITQNLSAGSHTIKLIGIEPNVKVDRVLAVADTACVPTGAGDNCTVQADTASPTATLTAPAENASVAGAYNVTATATDGKGVSKVEFYVGDTLRATDTTTPYAYSWPTTSDANGTYRVTVKAYDAAGNVGTDSATVQVRNGDTQAPTVPANVSARATAYNAVTVSWGASTDNVQVAGYIITRDGLPVATVGTAASYADTNVLGGKTYRYQVTAQDAVGNKSAASAAVSVTTPAAPFNDVQAPTTPANLTAVPRSTSQIDLSWEASADNTGVTGYDVYRAGVGGTPAKIITVATPGYGDTALKGATQYAYYVIAKDAKGNTSGPTQTVRATTIAPPTESPDDPTTPVVRSGLLRGKVTGRKDRALANVQVTLWADGKRYNATTNSKGVYRIDTLPEGRYTLKFAVSGYRTERHDVRIRDGKDTIRNTRLDQSGRNNSWWNGWWR